MRVLVYKEKYNWLASIVPVDELHWYQVMTKFPGTVVKTQGRCTAGIFNGTSLSTHLID